jgi:hypothetical protein
VTRFLLHSTLLAATNPDHAAAWYDPGVIRELHGNEELALEAHTRAVGLRARATSRDAVHHLEQRMN